MQLLWSLGVPWYKHDLLLSIFIIDFPVTTQQSSSEITQHLVRHHCPDITPSLDLSFCGNNPISWGGFGDIYRGRLLDGTQIAIKCARLHFSSHEASQKTLKVRYAFVFAPSISCQIASARRTSYTYGQNAGIVISSSF
jgi:hypothetical protein